MTTLIVSAMFMLSAPVLAQSNAAERATARQLGEQANEALRRGETETAEQRLTHALALHDEPSLRLARARARKELGRLMSAADDYQMVLFQWSPEAALPKGSSNARSQAEAELLALAPSVPRIVIRVHGGRASVRVQALTGPSPRWGARSPSTPETM